MPGIFAARLHGGRAEGHAAADIEAGQVAQVRRGSVHGRVGQAAAAVQAQRRQLRAQARDRHHARIAHLRQYRLTCVYVCAQPSKGRHGASAAGTGAAELP